MKALILAIGLLGIFNQALANGHTMQHGFILSADGKFASHLVANGHHSRQVEITGELSFEFPNEQQLYETTRALNNPEYFLLQAQNVDLTTLAVGQVLEGHIIQSAFGTYDKHNVITKLARFKIDKILMNVENPFFGNSTMVTAARMPGECANGLRC